MTKATLTTPSDRELRVERILNAKRDRVWRALTDPEQLAQWWGRGNKLQVVKYDFRVGGHWRFVEKTAKETHGFEGRFREIVPTTRVVKTFEWDGTPGRVIVETMTLEELVDGRTELVNLSLFSSQDDRDGMMASGMEAGMNESYAALDKLLGGKEPGARPFAGVRKVAFTMLPIIDPVRARKFYEETLGLRVGMAGSHGEMHYIEYDLPGGGCIALSNSSGQTPGGVQSGGLLALEVEDLGATIDRLKSLGVEFKGDVIKGPHCRMATCLDSEGNALLLHQLDRA